MNKYERRLREKKLWAKRIRRLKWWEHSPKIFRVSEHLYKKQTKPCSCHMCKMVRYSRKRKHKK